ncbi:MAG: hypothetical protein O7G85_11580 [Planctomycetota bacterium]|nr:hypothetical protein [Planctomycetota bacterium]
MKRCPTFFLLVGLCLVPHAILGCSQLTIHVDLYEKSRPDSKLGLETRANKGLRAVANLRPEIKKLFEQHRDSVTSNLNLIKQLETDPDAFGTSQRYLDGQKKFLTSQLDQNQSFEMELMSDLDGIKTTLNLAIKTQRTAIQEADLSNRLDGEIAANDLMIAANVLFTKLEKTIEFEFSEPKSGDTRPQRLLLRALPDLTRNLVRELVSQDEASLDESARSAIRLSENVSKTQDINLKNISVVSLNVSNALKKAEESTRQSNTNNPELMADDGDPFLRTIENGQHSSSQSWKKNFYFQKAFSTGEASYMIVRETPTRYVLHRARSDPSVLVKTQLRLARTGLKVVSTIMAASGAGVLAPGSGTSPEGDSSDAQEGIQQSINAASDSRAANSRIEDLRNVMQRKLREFDKFLDELNRDVEDARKSEATARLAVASDDGTNAPALTNKQKASATAKIVLKATTDLADERATSYFTTDVAPALKSYARQLELTSSVTSNVSKDDSES